MNQKAQFTDHQRSKRRRLFALFFSIALILVLAELRFVASFNDRISGQPAYMHHIAKAVAEALNTKLTSPAPILVAQDDSRHCETFAESAAALIPTVSST